MVGHHHCHHSPYQPVSSRASFKHHCESCIPVPAYGTWGITSNDLVVKFYKFLFYVLLYNFPESHTADNPLPCFHDTGIPNLLSYLFWPVLQSLLRHFSAHYHSCHDFVITYWLQQWPFSGIQPNTLSLCFIIPQVPAPCVGLASNTINLLSHRCFRLNMTPPRSSPLPTRRCLLLSECHPSPWSPTMDNLIHSLPHHCAGLLWVRLC